MGQILDFLSKNSENENFRGFSNFVDLVSKS